MSRPYRHVQMVKGWLIAILLTAMSIINILLPRAEKTSAFRESLRGFHYLTGITLLLLLLWYLVSWIRNRDSSKPGPVPAASTQLINWLCLTTVGLMIVTAALGFGQAATGGHRVHLAELIEIPALFSHSMLGWQFTGYFHSGLAICARLLSLVAVFTGLYTLLRYGAGLLRAFPSGFGAMFYASFVLFVYAVNSFSGPRNGLIAVAVVATCTALVWSLGWLLHRKSIPTPGNAGSASFVASTGSAIVLLGVVSFGLYLPHLLFRVTPLPTGERIEDVSGRTSHQNPVRSVEVEHATAFQSVVDSETFRWCRFCHTFKKDEKPLVGPNLYAIFGQRAGTVPNFYYSSALAQAGRKGLIWDDETLSSYLEDPDGFIPGTSMIISSGPVTDAERRAAVINILKMETMPQSHQEPALP